MVTVVEPKKYIDTLWSKQEQRNNIFFRLMRYVLKFDFSGKIALHNVVTGQLVLLGREETALLNLLPTVYSPIMEQLVDGHFLVPECFDEHLQVVKLREVLRKLSDVQRDKDITKYTILPTTACNARCYYCFEQGTETVTMTEQVANDVVEYIATHCGSKKSVFISWFGGEPTVAQSRIEQICEGLRNKDIHFSSTITTNGYLFDEVMADRAARLWNLKEALISLDGTELNYNTIKAYVNTKDNPFQRVLRNVGLLIENQIYVNLRMNYDLNNYMDFQDLVDEIVKRFGNNPYISLRAHPVNGAYKDRKGNISHATDSWFIKKNIELNNIARNAGLLKRTSFLPFLKYEGCEANSNSAVTISAKGTLVRCPEQFDDNQATGTLRDGITHPERLLSWKRFADYEKCISCVLYPKCNRLVNCSAGDRCGYILDSIYLYEETAKQIIMTQKSNL